MSDFLKSLGKASAVGAVDSALGSLFNMAGQKLQFKYNKKLFDYTFDKQKQFEIDKLLHEPELAKQGLVNAGLNTALMNGGQYNMAGMSTPNGDSGNFSVDIPIPDSASTLQALNTADYQAEVTRGQKIENDLNQVYLERIKAAEADTAEYGARKGKIEAEIAEESKNTALQTMEANLNLAVEQGQLTFQQYHKTMKEIEIADENLKSARIQNAHLHDSIRAQIFALTKNAAAALKSAEASVLNAQAALKQANTAENRYKLEQAQLKFQKEVFQWNQHVERLGLQGVSKDPGWIQSVLQSGSSGEGLLSKNGLFKAMDGVLSFIGLDGFYEYATDNNSGVKEGELGYEK